MKIVITNSLEKAIQEIKADEKIVVDEFRVEHIRELKRISYLTDENKKTILIAAKKYNIISQNALLKILEEPPKNTDFILLSPSRYSLLDTIKSRLPIEYKNYENKKEIDVNLDKINNELILDLLHRNFEKEELKAIIYTLIEKKNLKEDELRVLSSAIKMVELNIDKDAVISYVMLNFKGKE